MKKFIVAITSVLIMMFFTHCGSAQFDKEAPFTIHKAYYQDWFGGQPGSKGTLVTVEISPAAESIVFDSIFFNGKIKRLSNTILDNKQLLIGNFPTTTLSDKNIIMHSDPKEEMANKISEPTLNFPFELTDNECVVSYIIKKKKYYFKVENLKKEKSIYYP
ncbi:MAG: hypothetical protein QNK20_02845 [Aureibaculum sp.]|nr:hypothetical protein [Aureibaculum sp.]